MQSIWHLGGGVSFRDRRSSRTNRDFASRACLQGGNRHRLGRGAEGACFVGS